ncbi:hypothetical protein RRG08_010775 [Elysia crispata]|uniref:Uncharacterized protein n=1 Tax=Elysia crispata TaxID=231223 RepID=A0AAE1A363_9GAST|nr:hypothetical protein RRG08_010775 [Elysia crispata]
MNTLNLSDCILPLATVRVSVARPLSLVKLPDTWAVLKLAGPGGKGCTDFAKFELDSSRPPAAGADNGDCCVSRAGNLTRRAEVFSILNSYGEVKLVRVLLTQHVSSPDPQQWLQLDKIDLVC